MKRDTRIVAAFLGALASLILVASAACTWAIANGASARWALLFRPLCHGMPERSLELFGGTMPICARCTAIYAGLLAAIVLFMVMPRLNPIMLRTLVIIAAIPIGIDGVTQAIGLRESTNPLRIVTGIIAALAFGMWALSSVENTGERAFHTS